MSLRLRLVLLLLTIYCLGGWVIARWTLGQVRPRYFEAMEDSMVETALLLAGILEEERPPLTVASTERLARAVSNAAREPYAARIFSLQRESFGLRVYVADKQGVVLYDSASLIQGENRIQWDDIHRTLDGGYGARIETAADTPKFPAEWVAEAHPRLSWIFVGAPVIFQGEIIGTVSVGKATASIETLVRSAKWKILLGTAAGGLALLVGLLVTANWVVAPIEGLANWAREVRDGRPSRNPKAPGKTLGQLRDALVGMRESLEGREAVERYTRTLAHEIKAPLTAVRSAAELLREDLPDLERNRFNQIINEGAERIQRLVDEMLALSRLERDRAAFRLTPVALQDVITAAAAAIERAFEASGITLSIGPTPALTINGDQRLLIRAVLNLLQNALEFSAPGGSVTLSLVVDPQRAIIRIEDSGAGIPDYAQGRIFERFYSLPRPGRQTRSTGLGLSMVQEIMDLHGGTVSVKNRRSGGVCAELCWHLPQ